MLRWFFLVCAAIALAVSASAATIRLYLKDGTYQLAREYEVQSDRVHYFSTERGEWEDVPLELVDLKKTEAEVKQREEELKSEVKSQDEEDKAERAARKEAASVPMEAGTYYVNGTTLQPIKVAEAKVVNNKRRQVLKVLSPLPMVTGKSTLELDALHAPLVIAKPDPEFYIRLSEDERFGIIKMSEHQGHRVAEKITLVPVTNEVIEEPELVPIYRKQTADGVYKVWPQKPLEPGEYAVVEYTETKINMQIWDFAISGSAQH